MKYKWLSLVGLAAVLMLLAGCSKPDTPQQVATEFWRAIAEGKVSDAAELSTLADADAIKDIQSDWLTTLPDFGRVVIDANEATVNTILATNKSAGDSAADARREITTYLVRVNDQWLVDFQRTHDAMTDLSLPFSGLKDEISKLREQFDEVVGRSSEQISERMDQLAKDFDSYSEETGKKAEKALESFGESLKDFRQEIEKSLDEARKNREKSEEKSPEVLEQASI